MLNSPMHKKVIELMKQQGRDTSFETRKAIFNLHNLNKRLGEYKGTEAQNFALKNMIGNEEPHRDTMLTKAKGGGKYTFDVPGGSPYDGTGINPLAAQSNAFQQMAIAKNNYYKMGDNLYQSQKNMTGYDPSNLTVPDLFSNLGSISQLTSNQGQYAGSADYYNRLLGQATDLSQPIVPTQISGPGAAAPLPGGQINPLGEPQIQQAAQASALAAIQHAAVPAINPNLNANSAQYTVNPNTGQPQNAGLTNPAGVPGTQYDAMGNQIGYNPNQPFTGQGVLPGGLNSAVNTAQADPYANFVNVNGTIYNKATGVGYPTPEALAKDLGVAPNQIDWSKISAGQKPGDTGGGTSGGTTTGDTTGQGLYDMGANTPEGILAAKQAEMDKAAADVDTAGEKESFQDKIASAGLAFSGIRDKGEQDIAAANFAKKEGISLGLAQTILKAAVAEQKRQEGEIREIGNKLIRIKPDGTTETIYEDTSALTDEQKEEIKLQALGKELELKRQSTIELKKEEIKAGVRKAPGSGALSFTFGKTEIRTAAADNVFTEARKELTNNVGTDGNYDPDIFLRHRNKLQQTSPQDLNDFDKEFASKLNPLDRTRYGIGLGTTKADSGFSFTIDAASLADALGGE